MNQESTDQQEKNQSTRSQPASGQFSAWKALQTLLAFAFILATLFTLWTPANLFSNQLLDQMMRAYNEPVSTAYPTMTAGPKPRVGIVSGHSGYDSGSVCLDNLTEKDVNFKIADMVSKMLTDDGYQVDLLDEFDKRLSQYQAIALVSIHNDSCTYVNDEATGFKVAAAQLSASPEKADRLTACLTDRYKARTGMKFHANSITPDMTRYHAFGEINPATTAAIIETGFLYLDRDFLLNHTDLVAQGIRDGIVCFIRNEPVNTANLTQP